MTSNQSSHGDPGLSFTGRFAGWSGRHRWKILIGTIVLLIVAFGLNGAVGVETSEVMGAGEAQEAEQLFEDRFDIVEPADELILFYNPDLDVDDPAFRAVVEPVVADLRTYEGVASVESFYDTGADGMVSADRHVLVARLVFEPAETEDLEEWVAPIMDAVGEANDGMAGTGFEVSMLGGTSGSVAMENAVNDEFGMIMMVALVGGFIILVLAFGSVVAALVPLAMAIVSIFAAVGAAVVVSRVQPLNMYYYEMIILIGLAVGVDYSLFVISRFREAREDGIPKLDAIRLASGTAGRAVFYAGVTVVISVAGLLITRDPLFIGLGLGAVIVVFFSLIASLTLLPALLSLLGDNVNRLRIRGLGRPSHGGGIWGFITDRVLRRPAIFATVTLVLLLALASPLLSLHIGNTPISTDTMPEKLEGYRALELLEDHFGGLAEMSALIVVVDPGEGNNVDTPETRASVESFIEDLGHDSSFVAPFDTQVNQAGDLMLISVPVVDADDEDKAEAAVGKLRNDLIPAAFQTDGVDVLVGAGASYAVDARANVKSTAPAVFAFVLGLAFVLLLVMFRSTNVRST